MAARITRRCACDRTFDATTGGVLARRVERLREYQREWLAVNARWIHQRVRREFLRKVQLSGCRPRSSSPKGRTSSGSTPPAGAAEHEFSKTMPTARSATWRMTRPAWSCATSSRSG